MRCPFCNHEDTQVLETRVVDEGIALRRRRRCEQCDKRFTTYERVELQVPVVVKKDGSRVDYSRDKIRLSMQLALRKRPVSAVLVDEAISRIEDKLISSAAKEVSTEKLGELVMRELSKLDKIAYIRFASVYHSFEDLHEFRDVLQEVEKPKRR